MHEFVTLNGNLREPAREPHAQANGHGPLVFIQTYGCQMNVSDSQTIETMLSDAGFGFASRADDADVVLVNTCMIRESAEVRALGQLANLSALKKTNPSRVIGILGCVAQAKRKEILDSYPYVDMVIGPDSYRKLPILLEERRITPQGTPGLLETTLLRDELYDDIVPRHHGGVTAFVTIIRGCDKFCSFCVVPRTRGRERSRPLPSILREVEMLADQGVRDVMLLGQNVDSYQWEGRDFADCLLAVAELPSIHRVRYMTSHPSDITEKLLRTMGAHEKICPYLHLPVQSGNNRILEAMNRPYTREHYLHLIELARKHVPNLALSTDVIVGFPTESDAEFEDTYSLMREVRYDTAFTFKYSERPLTKASRMNDDVPEEIKVARLEKLIELQQQIARERNLEQLARTTQILIEGPSPKDAAMWTGRTPCFRPVVISRNGESVGDLVTVQLKTLNGFTFHAERTPH
ncbi:tRNA (N6-isopentenyl adenosine(37)-C2)-methylthiotransferase MiaB [bacterium]|nr:tRNA (N6-isopentenyl adenosine(37)-C2)-methylthiotransferase MiaB [bacterium]